MRVLKVISILILSLTISLTASAESHYACAAVYPCDDNGNLLKEFTQDGPCLDYYVSQCLIAKLQITRANLKACNFKNIGLEGDAALREVLLENDKLRKAKRKLRRKLKRTQVN